MATLETLKQYGRLQNLEAVKNDIENGAKFNGVVYGENKDSKHITVFVYVNGVKRHIKEIEKEDVAIVKEEVAEYLGVNTSKTTTASKTTEWTVDGKKINNNLSYAEMYERYGMDFE